ncbi:ABC transporter ATP-binding protein [Metabacillus sp. HB246100]
MAILETSDLTIAFGGQVAVDSVHLSIKEKSFTSIIGPNGAGKTTLFNLLSGQLKPTKGHIFFKGEEMTNLSPTKRTRKGMGRSFQITNVFPSLTVLENVRLAVQSQVGVRYQMLRHFSSYKKMTEEAYYLLERVMMEKKANTVASNLAHGEKRKLEIAMLLALQTDLLLLDEPTAGMSLEEVPAILDIIKEIKKSNERTILLIEHKMDMIMDLSDGIVVLFNGRKLAEGSPDEIMQNETVQTAYLGGLYDDNTA